MLEVRGLRVVDQARMASTSKENAVNLPLDVARFQDMINLDPES